MALTYSDANAVSTKYFNMGKLALQVYEENIILDKIKANGKKRYQGGTSILYSIRYKEQAQAKSVNPDAARVTASVGTRTQLELDWKYYVDDTVMTWKERVHNNGTEAIINLMADKYKEGLEDLQERLSDHFFQAYASTGSNDVTGIYSIIQAPASSTTYAGISSGDAASWVAGLYDTTTTTLSLFGTGSLEAGMRACWFRGQPDLIVTTKAIAGIYSSKLQPGERRQPQTGKAGAKTWATDLYFMGVPIIADPHCPDGDIIFLSTDNLWVFVQPDFDFKFAPWEDDPDRHNALRALLSFTGNFACDTRKKFGAYTAITS